MYVYIYIRARAAAAARVAERKRAGAAAAVAAANPYGTQLVRAIGREEGICVDTDTHYAGGIIGACARAFFSRELKC